MPDLLTHTIVAYVAAARLRRRDLTLVILGTVLPDALSVVPGLVLDWAADVAGFEVADPILNAPSVFHAPIPFALFVWLLALFRPPTQRWRFLVVLSLGGWLHIGLDFLQFHLSGPSYHPLYPFSSWAWEAAWIGTEDSLVALPLLVPVGIAIWSWRRRREEGSSQGV
ncbi:MAG: hypothetical protein OES47_01160 [Acidobacteriota bacterium]|nr:hypothetical protein [Acidobacteriota bacterium]